jgi:hypothetical protein
MKTYLALVRLSMRRGKGWWEAKSGTVFTPPPKMNVAKVVAEGHAREIEDG